MVHLHHCLIDCCLKLLPEFAGYCCVLLLHGEAEGAASTDGLLAACLKTAVTLFEEPCY
jgi:hypothetical protein